MLGNYPLFMGFGARLVMEECSAQPPYMPLFFRRVSNSYGVCLDIKFLISTGVMARAHGDNPPLPPIQFLNFDMRSPVGICRTPILTAWENLIFKLLFVFVGVAYFFVIENPRRVAKIARFRVPAPPDMFGDLLINRNNLWGVLIGALHRRAHQPRHKIQNTHFAPLIVQIIKE